MATLALAAVGAAIGGALLPSATILGATITGAAIGQAIGGMAGSFIDQALLGGSGQGRIQTGPRLDSLKVMASRQGAPVPRLYGRARLAGEVIWATQFAEVATESESSGGGKGLGGGGGPTQVSYSYFANFAVGLCEGTISHIGRVWADGKETDLAGVAYRLYTGTEAQMPDSLIEAKEGSGAAPAYRGLAYIVFERLPLAKFGNRLPQLNFEVFRPVGGLGAIVPAVTMIPGAGEFAYHTTEVQRQTGIADWAPENTHTVRGKTDWSVSLDELEQALPSVGNVSLFVSWFGDDLRAGNCTLKPRVDSATKITTPLAWSVGGLARTAAPVVSLAAGVAAYGGTPSDASVVAAIRDLTSRGLKTTFNPFILMDIPADNGLPDPYGGAAQAAYPWRGRITVSPAAGQPGTADKTAAAATQISAFAGTAQVPHFAISGDNVLYWGPAEWSYRRMVLHYAHLCKAAGGVDTFLIGSELKALTTARSSASQFPFVTALIQLAVDVKSVLGPSTKVTYAADWSEYFGHQPADGTGDVYFHLDPLWVSASIDAVGIDVYWPLSDWRDGTVHTDYAAGVPSPYDLAYMKGNIAGGEGYDWYYASPAARAAQSRTPITDGHGSAWVFRFKDIKSWWSNAHYNRPGGVPAGTPTAWVPQGKPVWFTELGCPAVDKGANQPAAFVDAKSAESTLPHASSGDRDDLIQRRLLEAHLETFVGGAGTAVNPISSVYGGPMVDPARLYVYTWDARPHPAFPAMAGVWGDAANWQRGHWITGRASSVPLATTVADILSSNGISAYETSELTGLIDGYVVDRVMSARAALQPLELAYFFDSFESGDRIAFKQRGVARPVAVLPWLDFAETSTGNGPFQLKRKQETDLPAVARLGYIDPDASYQTSAAESRRLAGHSSRVSNADLPLVLRPAMGQAIAERLLQDAHAARTEAQFRLPDSWLALEPGDIVTLQLPDRPLDVRLIGLSDGAGRDVEALTIQRAAYGASGAVERPSPAPPVWAFGKPQLAFVDLPLLRGDESPLAVRVAAAQNPWPGGVAIYRSADGIDFRLAKILKAAATMGVTAAPFRAGPLSRWDLGSELILTLTSGTLGMLSDLAVLSGANTLALETAPGQWEIVQFAKADLLAGRTYRLTKLLRGQAGTEGSMAPALAPGATAVLLDQNAGMLDLSIGQIGLAATWRYGPANRPLGHLSYADESRSFIGIGRRPYSPCHVRATRSPAGDLSLGWKRRTRIGGDGWEAPDVPLSEDSEAYEVDILSGTSTVRTLSSPAPSVIYTAAQQTSDFGAPQSSIGVKIYQLSQSFGRGTARAATF